MASTKNIDADLVLELYEAGYATTYIGKVVGCTPANIRNHLLNKGIVVRPHSHSLSYRLSDSMEVIRSILSEGGTLKEALKRLGINIDPNTVRRAACTRGIDLQAYLYLNKQNKNWLVSTPGHWKREDGKKYVIATCKTCGMFSEVPVLKLDSVNQPICGSCSCISTN